MKAIFNTHTRFSDEVPDLSGGYNHPSYYNPGEDDRDFFIRHKKAVRALLPAEFNDIYALDETSHFADLRRARNTVSAAIQKKLDESAKKETDWSGQDEDAYRGGLAFIKVIDQTIKNKESQNETNDKHGTSKGRGLFFDKNQKIANNSYNSRYQGGRLG